MNSPLASFVQQYSGLYTLTLVSGGTSTPLASRLVIETTNAATGGTIYFAAFSAVNVTATANTLAFTVDTAAGVPAERGIVSFSLTFTGAFSQNNQAFTGTAQTASGPVNVTGSVLKLNPAAQQFWKAAAWSPTLLNNFIAAVQQGQQPNTWNPAPVTAFLQQNGYACTPDDVVQANIDTFNDLYDWTGTYRVVFGDTSTVHEGTLLTIQNGVITIGADAEVISNYTFSGNQLTWAAGSGSTSYPTGSLTFQFVPGGLPPSPSALRILGAFTGTMTSAATGSATLVAMGLSTTVIPQEQQALNIVNGDIATALHDYFLAAYGINVPTASIAQALQVIENIIYDLYQAYSAIRMAWGAYQVAQWLANAAVDVVASAVEGVFNAWNANLSNATQQVANSVSGLNAKLTQIKQQYPAEEDDSGGGEEGGGESGGSSSSSSSSSTTNNNAGGGGEEEPSGGNAGGSGGSGSGGGGGEEEPSGGGSSGGGSSGGGGGGDDDDDDDDLSDICCCACCC